MVREKKGRDLCDKMNSVVKNGFVNVIEGLMNRGSQSTRSLHRGGVDVFAT